MDSNHLDQEDIESQSGNANVRECEEIVRVPSSSWHYAEGTNGATRNGFFLNLTPEQEEVIAKLQQFLMVRGMKMGDLDSSGDPAFATLTLLRHLRANQWSIEKTIDHITRTMDWRREMNVKHIISQNPEDLLGMRDVRDIMVEYPHWHRRYDKQGRPVLYKQYGRFETASLLGKTTFEGLVDYHVWEQEACMEMCRESTRRTGQIVETFTAVIDIAGMQLRQIGTSFMKIIQAVADVDQKYYPETMGAFFVINCPSAFPFVWRAVKAFLDPVVASKIQVISSRSKWEPALLDMIGEDNLPVEYGGKGPPLLTSEHPYAETANLQAGGMREWQRRKHAKEEIQRREMDEAVKAEMEDSHEEQIKTIGSGWGDEIDFARSYLRTQGKGYRRNGTAALSALGRQTSDDAELVWYQKLLYCTYCPSFIREFKMRTIFGSEWDREDSDDEDEADRQEDEEEEDGQRDDDTVRDEKAVTFMSLFTKKQKGQRGVCRETRRIGILLRWSIGMSAFVALVAIGLGAYFLTVMYWNSKTVLVQMWAAVLVVMISCSGLLVNVAGYVGVTHRNGPLLYMFTGYSVIVVVVFFATATVSFLHAVNIGTLANESYRYVEGSASEAEVEQTMRNYNVALGSYSVLTFLVSLLPTILSWLFLKRLRSELRLRPLPRQLRALVVVAQSLSIIFAAVMTVYGAYALNYVMVARLVVAVFPIFGMVYGGITLMLSSFTGFWVARTHYHGVIRLFYLLVLPVTLFINLQSTISCIEQLININEDIGDAYLSGELKLTDIEGLDESDKLDSFKAIVTSQLLVASTLGMFVCLVNLLSLVASRSLYLRLEEISPSWMRFRVGVNSYNNNYAKRFPAITGTGTGTEARTGSGHITLWGGSVAGGEGTVPESESDRIRARDRDRDRSSMYGGRRSPRHHMGKREPKVEEPPLSRTEKLITSWAVIVGLFCIYFQGTFAVFSVWVQEVEAGVVTHLWTRIGNFDSRYVDSDPFLLTSDGFAALVLGPLLLLYAKSTFTRAPERHTIGPLCATLLLFTQIMYFGTELHRKFDNFHYVAKDDEAAAAVFFASHLLRTILPALVLRYELVQVYYRVKLADASERGRMKVATESLRSLGVADVYLGSRKRTRAVPGAGGAAAGRGWGGGWEESDDDQRDPRSGHDQNHYPPSPSLTRGAGRDRDRDKAEAEAEVEVALVRTIPRRWGPGPGSGSGSADGSRGSAHYGRGGGGYRFPPAPPSLTSSPAPVPRRGSPSAPMEPPSASAGAGSPSPSNHFPSLTVGDLMRRRGGADTMSNSAAR